MMQSSDPAIAIDGLSLHYGALRVVHGLSLAIPRGAFTALIGPNGCGKSTLLKGLTRVLPAMSGGIHIEGRPLVELSARALAQRVALLPQVLPVPEGITVRQLVAYGRSPHNNIWGRLDPTDRAAIDRAMDRMQIVEIADRPVSDLSGGQRQRVWIAMVVAQETPIVLLDEPTTFLDINRQIDVLRFARRLAAEGKAVVAVLHDLNQAFRYADHVAVMKAGRLISAGAPAAVAEPELLREVFSIDTRILSDPESGSPLLIIREP